MRRPRWPGGATLTPSGDARRLTAHPERGGPCIAVAERQPDGQRLVNGRAMSREHAGIELEAAVTVAATSRHRQGAARRLDGLPRAEGNVVSGAATAEIIQ